MCRLIRQNKQISNKLYLVVWLTFKDQQSSESSSITGAMVTFLFGINYISFPLKCSEKLPGLAYELCNSGRQPANVVDCVNTCCLTETPFRLWVCEFVSVHLLMLTRLSDLTLPLCLHLMSFREFTAEKKCSFPCLCNLFCLWTKSWIKN